MWSLVVAVWTAVTSPGNRNYPVGCCGTLLPDGAAIDGRTRPGLFRVDEVGMVVLADVDLDDIDATVEPTGAGVVLVMGNP